MKIYWASLKMLLIFAIVSLLTSCAIWKGGIPTYWRDGGKYPIITNVCGIKEVSYSTSLQKIVISYIPTNEIVLDTNTTVGFMIQIQPAEKPLYGREFYVLPKAARWNTTKKQIVSMDHTTCVTDFYVPKGAKYIEDSWGMFADDPLGEYEIAIFLDNKMAADFKFHVIAKTSPKN